MSDQIDRDMTGSWPVTPHAAFTCPRCRRTSHNPTDLTEGYCGACRDWTAPAAPARQVAARASPGITVEDLIRILTQAQLDGVYVGSDIGTIVLARYLHERLDLRQARLVRDREQLRQALQWVVAAFRTEEDHHPGSLRTGWIDASTVERWRRLAHPGGGR